MNAIPSPRITSPSVLSALKRTNLHALLLPFADYFADRGFQLDLLADEDKPLDELISILSSPVESTPADLIDRLELLDLISDSRSTLNFEEGYEEIVARFRDKEDTPADLAVKILLNRPDLAWREFNRKALLAPRSMLSLSVRPGMVFQPVTPERIERLQRLMAPWFESNARSGICHVHARQEQGGVSFVIRHGDLLKRIGIYDEDGKPTSCILRPERVDIAHFRMDSGEWRISGLGSHLQELYRQAFGAVFYGSTKALAHAKRYSLEPLRDGPRSLACEPGSNIRHVSLNYLKIQTLQGNLLTVSRGDVFAILEEFPACMWHSAKLIEARIDFRLARRRRLASVIINPGNEKVSGIQPDDTIETWLANHQFTHRDHESLLLESN